MFRAIALGLAILLTGTGAHAKTLAFFDSLQFRLDEGDSGGGELVFPAFDPVLGTLRNAILKLRLRAEASRSYAFTPDPDAPPEDVVFLGGFYWSGSTFLDIAQPDTFTLHFREELHGTYTDAECYTACSGLMEAFVETDVTYSFKNYLPLHLLYTSPLETAIDLELDYQDAVIFGSRSLGGVDASVSFSGDLRYIYSPAIVPLPAALPLLASVMAGLFVAGRARARRPV